MHLRRVLRGAVLLLVRLFAFAVGRLAVRLLLGVVMRPVALRRRLFGKRRRMRSAFVAAINCAGAGFGLFLGPFALAAQTVGHLGVVGRRAELSVAQMVVLVVGVEVAFALLQLLHALRLDLYGKCAHVVYLVADAGASWPSHSVRLTRFAERHVERVVLVGILDGRVANKVVRLQHLVEYTLVVDFVSLENQEKNRRF